jgi:hypothetical protein
VKAGESNGTKDEPKFYNNPVTSVIEREPECATQDAHVCS